MKSLKTSNGGNTSLSATQDVANTTPVGLPAEAEPYEECDAAETSFLVNSRECPRWSPVTHYLEPYL